MTLRNFYPFVWLAQLVLVGRIVERGMHGIVVPFFFFGRGPLGRGGLISLA